MMYTLQKIETRYNKESFNYSESRYNDLYNYFNCFSCKAYHEYTEIRAITLKVSIEGEAFIQVWHYKDNGEKYLLSEKCSNNGKSDILIDVILPDSGILLSKICLNSNDTVVYDAEWCTNIPPNNDVSLALIFCTYKREEYVKNNVQRIKDFIHFSNVKCDIIVVDNGNTLHNSDVEGAELFYNKNLGGSGGFSRGMLEAYKKGKYSHIILMDDDISFNTEIIDRIKTLLSYSKEKNLAIGAAMLCEDNPTLLYELGGLWNGDRLCSLYKNIDVADENNLVFDNFNADYSAWWCCCIPMDAVKRNGLSMPFFIKNDDVEYGVRCGFKWAFLDGVAVWHASFDKKYSPHLEYYIKRNELISNCLNVKRGGLSQYIKIVRSVALQLVNQRYFAIPYIMEGAEDFLRGAEYFSQIDAQLKNSKLIGSLPKMMTKNELQSKGYNLDYRDQLTNPKKWKQVLTLNGYLLPPVFYGKYRKDYIVVDMMHAKPGQFYKKRIVVQYNNDSDQGFVTVQRKKELFVWGWSLVKLGIKFLFNYSRAKKSYIENHKRLTSIEYWEHIFNK